MNAQKVVGVLLLASGCAASLPPSAEMPLPEEQIAIEAAVSAWREAGLPWSAECSEQFDRIHVVVSEPHEFTELCGRRPLHAGGRLYACNTEQYEHMFPLWVVDDSRVPLLVISRLQPQVHQRLLVVHETMHWLERCSGKGIDFEHADDTVWEQARADAQRTVVATLQSRRTGHRVMWSQADEKQARRRTNAPRPTRVSTRQ